MKVLLLLIALAAAGAAQEKETAVPVAREPHHKLVLENEYTRVYEVKVAAHEATALHRHDHDYVGVILAPAQVQNAVVGKPEVSARVAEGEVRFVSAGVVHRAINQGDAPFHNFTIEVLKKKPPARSGQRPERGLDVGHGGLTDVVVDNDVVRVTEVQIAAGGMVHKHRHPYPYLLVALADLSLHDMVQGKPAAMVEQKENTVRWFPAGGTHEVMNMGRQEARFITVEFK